ncbi:MAG: LuxR C-terminal-related transcriptional regulator [Candidatus Promineifilaceae bacterium]|nr:LuxR C-terminal-related transcriptional regulator [Candidatus Promineifilaceae bacterium]
MMNDQSASGGKQLTSFIGREQDIAAIMKLLADEECRLLTVTGPGGIGKTRLCVELSERLAGSGSYESPAGLFPDGVFFVSLQALEAAGDIYAVVAAAVGFDFYDAHRPEKQLSHYLAEKNCLLILDNLEHLVDASEVIASLTGGVAQVKILATSREPLFLPEEWLYRVKRMSVPDLKDPRYADFDAVRLFVERARRVRHDFALEEEKACVIAICRLVDGMPLAIEMAAGWLRSLNCQDIAQEIEQNLDLLQTHILGVPQRQRNMRAVIDYSWQLLDVHEQDLFLKLSVFEGGFTQEAAAAAAGATLQTLSSLVDKSMIGAPKNGRYHLHELSRRYATEKLALKPEVETTLRNRHCNYFCAYLDQPYRFFYGRESRQNLAAIDADLSNIESAWSWAVNNKRWDVLSDAIQGLYHYAFLRFWHQGFQRALDLAFAALESLAASREKVLLLGKLLAFQASFALSMGRQQEAQEAADRSFSLLEPWGAGLELSNAALSRAWVYRFAPDRDPAQAEELILEAAVAMESTGQIELQGFMYAVLGGLMNDIGEYRASERWYRKALDISRRMDDPRGITGSLSSLSRLMIALGEHEEARIYLQEGLQLAWDMDYKIFYIGILTRMGQLELVVGNLDSADANLEKALRAAREWGKPYELANALITAAQLKTMQEELSTARKLYAEALPHIESSLLLEAERLRGLGCVAWQEGDLKSAREMLMASREIGEARRFRLLVAQNDVALGRLALQTGDAGETRLRLQRALQESVQIGSPPAILDSLIGAGEWLAEANDGNLAGALAQLVGQSPAASAESKGRARDLLQAVAVDGTAAGTVDLFSDQDLVQTAYDILARLQEPDPVLSPIEAANRQLPEPLSPREMELLRLVAAGKSNREIAAELFIALGTVKSHLHHIYQKLGVDSRTQAIVRGRGLGLL